MPLLPATMPMTGIWQNFSSAKIAAPLKNATPMTMPIASQQALPLSAALSSITAHVRPAQPRLAPMSQTQYQGFTLTWAGECSAWECDELGHLNMRHYIKKFSQARQFLIIQLGLKNAFKRNSLSTVRVKDLYIKYLGEARPGQPLKIMSAVLSVSDQTLRLCHIMYHSNGHIAASQIETVEHIYLRNYKPFHWPSRLLQKAQSFCQDCSNDPPRPALPRNINTLAKLLGHPRNTLEGYGLDAIGVGVIGKDEISAAGLATSEAIIGRSASTFGWFEQGWPELYDPAYMSGHGSAAVLEIYATFHKDMRQGDAYEYRAGVTEVNQYSRTFFHSLNDAMTGEPLSSLIMNGCLFNLKTRKLTKSTPEQLARLTPHLHSDLL